MSDDIQVPNDENSSEESPKSNKCEDSGYPIQRDHNKDDEHIVGEIMKITSNRDKLEKELILYGNPHYIKYPTKIGKVYSFAYHKDTPLVVISTRLYRPIVFLLVLLISSELIMRIIPEALFIYKVVIVIPFIFCICSFVFLLVVNPGIPNRKHYLSESVLQSIMSFIEYTQTEKFDRYKICKKCNIYVEKDINITHCNYCDICILDNDDHYSLLGKCISTKFKEVYKTMIVSAVVYMACYVLTILSIIVYLILK